MERDILLDNFASLIVRQAIPFPLVGEFPNPPKNPDGCFRLPSKVRQALRQSAQKKCRRQYRNDTACIFLFLLEIALCTYCEILKISVVYFAQFFAGLRG